MVPKRKHGNRPVCDPLPLAEVESKDELLEESPCQRLR